VLKKGSFHEVFCLDKPQVIIKRPHQRDLLLWDIAFTKLKSRSNISTLGLQLFAIKMLIFKR
jgi:hypothetical protein